MSDIKGTVKENLTDDNMYGIFDTLLNKIGFLNTIYLLINIDNPYRETYSSIVFASKEGKDTEVIIKDRDDRNFILKEVLEKYTLRNTGKILDYLRHHFTTHLSDIMKSDRGKYYTPRHLVELVFQMVSPHVGKDSIVLDPACGCGAFLDEERFPRLVGTDMDNDAVEVLNILGFENVFADNSLLNVSRNKYSLEENSHLVIIGNPPYNDRTSRNKKRGKNAKKQETTLLDGDLHSRDLGISFLKAFDKLDADVICILHPLAYIIKKANFRRLGDFTSHYMLKQGIIFSSQEFSDTQCTPFPIVAALYVRGNMDYRYIMDFRFDILYDNRKFVLANIETIDGYIRKYPPGKRDEKRSDTGLYMYNIRDINSLLGAGNLTDREDFRNQVTINFKDLYKYSYLNCMKRYFGKDFLFGNLSPIVDGEALENDEYLQDLFTIDTMIRNRRLSAFNLGNPGCILYSRNLMERYEEKGIVFRESGREEPDIYSVILDYARNNEVNTEEIERFIRDYFMNLKKAAFKSL